MSCDTYCCNHGCNQGRDCPARHAPITRVDLSRVQLDGTQPARRAPSAAAHLVKRLAQWLGAAAVVAIWMLACAATDQDAQRTAPTHQPTQWEAA